MQTWTPVLTMVGRYTSPPGPRSPAASRRITISSSAELDGAHTKARMRRPPAHTRCGVTFLPRPNVTSRARADCLSSSGRTRCLVCDGRRSETATLCVPRFTSTLLG